MDGSLFRWQTATGFNGIVKCISEDDAQRPVSYTHLDVYKRQVKVCPSFDQAGLDRIAQTVLGGLVDHVEWLHALHIGQQLRCV